MKRVKSFRITEENEKVLRKCCKQLDLSEGWIVNQALQMYFQRLKDLNPHRLTF